MFCPVKALDKEPPVAVYQNGYLMTFPNPKIQSILSSTEYSPILNGSDRSFEINEIPF